MKIVGLTITRNDDWSLPLALSVALRWCDSIVVLDHASTDNTQDLLASFAKANPGRIHRLYEGDGNRWDEMDHRQRTLEAARALNPTHLAIIDSDELLTDNLIDEIRSMIDTTCPEVTYGLPQVSPYHSLDTRRIDGAWGRRSIWTMAFKNAPHLHWAHRNGYQLHHRHPFGADECRHLIHQHGTEEQRMAIGGVIHLQHASYRRLRAKAVWYKMLETISYPGKRPAPELNRMYDWTLRTDDMEHRPIPQEWWGRNQVFVDSWLRMDAEPWQEREARRMMQEHGAAAFAGIDFHGLELG